MYWHYRRMLWPLVLIISTPGQGTTDKQKIASQDNPGSAPVFVFFPAQLASWIALNTTIPMSLSRSCYGEEAIQRCESELTQNCNCNLEQIHPKLTQNPRDNHLNCQVSHLSSSLLYQCTELNFKPSDWMFCIKMQFGRCNKLWFSFHFSMFTAISWLSCSFLAVMI